ncbi:MAG: SDR family NAD(P)-dependent oxidoreductase, partial [Proteobacteria bacterium]|nr:SDR family NAD(P)-dependent oxidoreductase [Pseudomonadota bacterium]
MDLELANRSVLVTGASSGIGLAAAQVFVQEGARVAICARGAERLEAVRRQLDPQGKSGVLAIAADLSQPSAALALAQQVTSNLGPVEVLVNNVGGPPPGNNNSIDDAGWARAVELTLMSAVRMARAVLPGMRARRWGRIVNVSSTSVKQPIDNLLLSNSIRLAVLGWAKTLANEVAADNVLVNTVCPG